ncbi:MAG TPA: hypothetical protein VM073_02820 [Usitatibacter sp.]|nr:hypothetical protein [Usitatibacter sp.]
MSLRALLAAAFACWIAPALAQYGPPPNEGEEFDLGIYTALWWNPAETGWGINTTHQGGILFATLFTYAADGQPLWLVASSLTRTMDDPYGYGMGMPGYSGALYRTTGPAFNASPWTAFGVDTVGSMTMEFLTPRALG